MTTGTEHRMVRARLARSAGFAGDLETARAALDGLELEEDAADGPILLARGHLAFFTGDIDEAWDIADRPGDARLTGRPVAAGGPGDAAGSDRAPPRRVVRALPAGAAAYAGTPADGDRDLRRSPVRGGVPAVRSDALRRGHRSDRGLLRATPRTPAPCEALRSRPRSSARRRCSWETSTSLSASCKRPSICTATSTRRRGRPTACSVSPRSDSRRATRWRHGNCCSVPSRWLAGR